MRKKSKEFGSVLFSKRGPDVYLCAPGMLTHGTEFSAKGVSFGSKTVRCLPKLFDKFSGK
jgi:hypothetical protein